MQYRLNHFLVLMAVVTFVVGCQQQAAEVPSDLTVDVQPPVVAAEALVVDAAPTAVVAVSHGETMVVDAACGTCQFGLEGDDCELAVRFGGTAYFVDGTSIDDHGDAHATDGFCNVIRPATVQGVVENGRFLSTSFALLADNSDHGSDDGDDHDTK